ncbi:MAG: sodium:solute symporter family protein [Thermoguttaceae bacterium]|nr:sodium:solute symporter family protein [Thermoguttaceae bacterium]MDW8038059.1 sodium:solute symporter family protein [Thermoguttaceae bacterium]
MSLTLVDWAIIGVYLVGCVAAGVWMKRYVRHVEDFAIAGREMDVYLGVASLAATEVGIVTIMYTAEMGFTNGPAGATPGVLMALAMFLVGMTGFVITPMRNAGVMTIPELLEKRFGVKVRWLAGLVIILGGVLNMGIFLRLGGEFLVHLIGLPKQYLELTMTGLLALVLLYTVLGGMLSVLVTDYLQFLVMGLGIVITSVLVLWHTPWPVFTQQLAQAHQAALAVQEQEPEKTNGQSPGAARSAGPDKSASSANQPTSTTLTDPRLQGRPQAKLPEGSAAQAQNSSESANPLADKPLPAGMKMGNPFNPVGQGGLGWMWVLWQAMTALAVVTTWQTIIARVLAARDARTAKRIYRRTAFYFVGRFALPGLWGAAAFLYFWHEGGLPEGVNSLSAMPRFLATLLPVGLLGLMVAAMLAAEMSTDSGYLLTWATVIYNDLLMPLKRRKPPERVRLMIIRILVVLIGLFLVFYGLWYPLPGKAWDYLAVTGNIYLASLFTLLVGALYWPRANQIGAIAAIILGAAGPLSFLIVNFLHDWKPTQFPWKIAPEVAGLAAFGCAFVGMIIGSLLGQRLLPNPTEHSPAGRLKEPTKPHP